MGIAKKIFIIHESGSLKFDLKTIYYPEMYKLYLVTKKQNGVILKPDNVQYFEKILKLNSFTMIELEEYIIQEADNQLDSIALITHDEYSISKVAMLREKLQVKGPILKDVEPFTNKITMKNKVKKHNIRIPKFIHFDPSKYENDSEEYVEKIFNHIGAPLFAKKTDSTCSDGCKKLNDFKELKHWAIEHSDCLNYEIDEYINGKLYHIDSIIFEKEVIHVEISEYAYPNAQFMEGKPLGSITLPPSHEIYKKLKDFNIKLLHALNPIDGTTHLEVFVDKTGDVVFLEIASRGAGALIPMVYMLHSGINYREIFFRIHIGLEFELNVKEGPYVAWLWFPLKSGIIKKFNTPDINSQYELKWNKKVNEMITEADNVRGRLGEIVLKNDNFDILYNDFKYLSQVYQPCDLV